MIKARLFGDDGLNADDEFGEHKFAAVPRQGERVLVRIDGRPRRFLVEEVLNHAFGAGDFEPEARISLRVKKF